MYAHYISGCSVGFSDDTDSYWENFSYEITITWIWSGIQAVVLMAI